MPIPRTQSWPRRAQPQVRARHYHDPSTAQSSLRQSASHRTGLSHELYEPRHVYSHTPQVVYPDSIRPPASNVSDVDEGEPYHSGAEDYGHVDHGDHPDQGYHEVEDYESDASEVYTHTPCPCSACGSPPEHAYHHARYASSTVALSYPPSYQPPHEPNSKPTPVTLTSLLFRFLNAYVLPHLPDDLAEVIRNPPDLTQPQTLVPLIRALAPYTQYLLVLFFFYIIWAFVAGFVGYTVRFIRFCFRIGPVIALIAWIMAASGQGGIDVVFEALKQYAGLSDANAPPARGPPGRATRANPHGYGYDAGRRHGRRPAGSSGSGWRKPAPPADQPDILSAIFGNPATGEAGMGAQVQSFVKAAVARGLGLDWLVAPPKEEKKKSR